MFPYVHVGYHGQDDNGLGAKEFTVYSFENPNQMGLLKGEHNNGFFSSQSHTAHNSSSDSYYYPKPSPSMHKSVDTPTSSYSDRSGLSTVSTAVPQADLNNLRFTIAESYEKASMQEILQYRAQDIADSQDYFLIRKRLEKAIRGWKFVVFMSAARDAQFRAADSLQDSQPDVANMLRYHAVASHPRPGVQAEGGSGKEWRNCPKRTRRHLGAPCLDLPPSTEAAGCFTDMPEEIDLQKSSRLGTFFHDALGLTGWKQSQDGTSGWSVRANPSGGATYPLEAHLFASVDDGEPYQWHYHPFWHCLEETARLPAHSWACLQAQLPKGAIVIGLTSIYGRTLWKYGDPAFRYVQQDIGHALGSISFAAAAQNCAAVLLESVTDEAMEAFVRPQHPEVAVCLIAVYPLGASAPSPEWWNRVTVDTAFWMHHPPPQYTAQAVEIRGDHWKSSGDLCEAAMLAGLKMEPPPYNFWWRTGPPSSVPSFWQNISSQRCLRPLFHQRRSADGFIDKGSMPLSSFVTIMRGMLQTPIWLPWEPTVVPVLFVNRVEGLDPGLYLLPRGQWHLQKIKNATKEPEQFLWQPVGSVPADVPLILLERKDVRRNARTASCVQRLAGDSCFTVSFLTEHLSPMQRHGAWMYQRGHWEAGTLGHCLYLAANSAGFGASGVGCFYGPFLSALLSIDPVQWQDVYHFAVGLANKVAGSSRLSSLGAYHHLEGLRGMNRDAVDAG